MKGVKQNKMNKIVAILVTLIGLIYTLGALDLYAVPQGDAIIGIAILIIGVPALIKAFK
jgi:uncharacterized membrane protein|tara:strand:- start:46 stop:222 length:177 start_codon:yes stop_codon:yes gene_type:complete